MQLLIYTLVLLSKDWNIIYSARPTCLMNMHFGYGLNCFSFINTANNADAGPLNGRRLRKILLRIEMEQLNFQVILLMLIILL